MSEENKVDIKAENENHEKQENHEKGEPSNVGVNPESEEKLLQQIEKWKSDYLYLRAEFDTYKRNAIKERADISKYGSERLVNEILTIVDNFDRALNIKLTNENIDVYSQGVKMTASELKSVLTRFGVTELKCEGLPFDPNLHEAIATEESESIPEGHILSAFRPAYKLHDRVIRPAQVIVAKAKLKDN